MKKIIVSLALVLLSSAALYATITLNTGQIQRYQLGPTVIETDDTVSAIDVALDFTNKRVVTTLQLGSVSGGVFTSGTHGTNTVVNIDSVGGIVKISGRADLVLTPTQQTAVQTQMKAFQTQLETTLNSWGVVPGTVVAN